MSLKEKIHEETFNSIEWTEIYEKNRDEAYKTGMKNNRETIEKLSNNEKEDKRHSCLKEMATTQEKIMSLWEKIALKTYQTTVLQTVVQSMMIAIFSILFVYAYIRDYGFFIMAIIAIGEFLAVLFLKLKITFEALAFITGLASTGIRMNNYYEKYGNLESILKLSDYRNLHENEVRKNLLHSQITKDS